MNDIKVIRHKRIDSCLSDYFGCKPKDLCTMEGYFEWEDADGEYHKMEVQESIAAIRKRKAWGWVDNKKEIHVFIRRTASIRDAVKLLAHEIGHMQRPFHKTTAEERKACRYADVAVLALDIAIEIIGNKGM